jgi:hypothetical protein
VINVLEMDVGFVGLRLAGNEMVIAFDEYH